MYILAILEATYNINYVLQFWARYWCHRAVSTLLFIRRGGEEVYSG